MTNSTQKRQALQASQLFSAFPFLFIRDHTTALPVPIRPLGATSWTPTTRPASTPASTSAASTARSCPARYSNPATLQVVGRHSDQAQHGTWISIFYAMDAWWWFWAGWFRACLTVGVPSWPVRWDLCRRRDMGCPLHPRGPFCSRQNWGLLLLRWN